ncbi:MAK10-like protein, partial [Tanacetum coccineum]
LYDNESWNESRDFAKPVKAISLPQDVLITSDRRLIKHENQVHCLMEAHLAPNPPIQVNKITSSCEICSGPHDTQYCMENPEQDFVEYDARLFEFEADFKKQQDEMTIKINTFLKVINDRMMVTLTSDMIKNPKLNVNLTSLVSSAYSYLMGDPQSSSRPLNSINSVKTFLTHAPICSAMLDKYVESLEFGKNRLLEETDHVLGLADETKSYPVGIVKNTEVHIGRLKLLDDFYVIDMDKDPATPLLVGRGLLATASAVIDCKKAKIKIGEGITRLIFGVKEINVGDEEVPYWTTIGKMVELLGTIPINLKGNMWESEELIENRIDRNRPPKEGDGAWHTKIELIDPYGEIFKKTFQSIPTTRKFSKKENPSEIIDLDHFHDF